VLHTLHVAFILFSQMEASKREFASLVHQLSRDEETTEEDLEESSPRPLKKSPLGQSFDSKPRRNSSQTMLAFDDNHPHKLASPTMLDPKTWLLNTQEVETLRHDVESLRSRNGMLEQLLEEQRKEAFAETLHLQAEVDRLEARNQELEKQHGAHHPHPRGSHRLSHEDHPEKTNAHHHRGQRSSLDDHPEKTNVHHRGQRSSLDDHPEKTNVHHRGQRSSLDDHPEKTNVHHRGQRSSLDDLPEKNNAHHPHTVNGRSSSQNKVRPPARSALSLKARPALSTSRSVNHLSPSGRSSSHSHHPTSHQSSPIAVSVLPESSLHHLLAEHGLSGYEAELQKQGITELQHLSRLTTLMVEAIIPDRPVHQRKLLSLSALSQSGGGGGGGNISPTGHHHFSPLSRRFGSPSPSAESSKSSADDHHSEKQLGAAAAATLHSDSGSPQVGSQVGSQQLGQAHEPVSNSLEDVNVKFGNEFQSVTSFLKLQGVEVPQDISYEDMVVPIQLGKLIEWVQTTASALPARATEASAPSGRSNAQWQSLAPEDEAVERRGLSSASTANNDVEMV
jgi:hypothetical protein